MPLKLTQITDTHLSQDTPSRTNDLENAVSAILALPEADTPDLVVHTGDITHNSATAEYKIARRCLEKLPCPVFTIPGNKDKREDFMQAYGTYEHIDVSSGFAQYSLENYPVRLIFLDTHDSNTNQGELCEQRMAHLRTMLEQDRNRPVVIFMHHPPFEAMEIPQPRQFTDWGQVSEFTEITAGFDNIERIICGHVHRNIVAQTGAIPVHALTCMAGDLRKGEVADSDRKLPVMRHFLLGD